MRCCKQRIWNSSPTLWQINYSVPHAVIGERKMGRDAVVAMITRAVACKQVWRWYSIWKRSVDFLAVGCYWRCWHPNKFVNASILTKIVSYAVWLARDGIHKIILQQNTANELNKEFIHCFYCDDFFLGMIFGTICWHGSSTNMFVLLYKGFAYLRIWREARPK